MMRLKAAAVAIASSVLMFAGDYRISPAEGASLRLEVQKTGLLRGKKHVFDFSGYNGTMAYDPSSPTASTVRFTIVSASIRCLDEWPGQKDLVKIQHYAEHEMLAIKSYPHIEFQSTRVTADTAARFHVQGMLTIRNKARPAVIDVTLQSDGHPIAWAQGQALVKLSDYGLKPASAALGAIGTKDEMKLTFRLKVSVS